MMAAKKTHSISFALLFILCGVIQNSFATHISEPVLIDPPTQFKAGDMVILHGRVDYNAQPTPDVLLNFKLIRPDGTMAVDQSYSSNAAGHFEFKFDSKDEVPGTYQITITSHCLEIHRYACTYKNQTLSFELK